MLFTTPNKTISGMMGSTPDEVDSGPNGSDRLLLYAVLALMVFGSIAVYSASAYFAETKGTTAFNLVGTHLTNALIAFIVLLFFSKIDYRKTVMMSTIGLIISWVMLAFLPFYGTTVYGAERFLSLGGFSFQPSSLATVMLLMHISAKMARKQEVIKNLKEGFWPVFRNVLVTCVLIGIEDFSTAGLVFVICLLLMFIGRISIMQLMALAAIGIVAGTIAITTSTERGSRLDEYISQISNINSTEFNIDEGYQAQQAYIAIAQGELFGVGMGKSTQRDFLPAPYNDFIFAIISEEYGLVGAAALMLVFMLILFRGIAVVAKNAPDTLGMLLATACTLLITLYAFVNAAVASGLFPVTGLPMPFVSYGGSSMLFSGMMMGILLNISKHNKKKKSVFYA